MGNPKTAIRPEYVRRAIMGHAAHAGISMADVAQRLNVARTYLYEYLANPDNWIKISRACDHTDGWLERQASRIQSCYGSGEESS